MPNAWSRKDERQYQHIKSSARNRGKSAEQAEEIAACTVNKQRRKDRRTPRRTSKGTGNPNSGLATRSKRELYNRARELDIPGRSKMDKDALLHAIRARQ